MRTVFRSAEADTAFGAATVRRRVRRGQWRRPARGVVVTHSRELDRREQQELALCLAPPASALGGLTALERDRLKGFGQTTTWVVLPEGARRPQHDAVFHWSTRLDHEDVHPTHEPRRTRTARSLVDAASWAPSDRAARTYVIAAFQQGLVSARTVREALQRRGPCRRRALIVESVLDAVGGIQSLPERDFDDVRRSVGLPAPTRQARAKGSDGRFHLDATWDDWDIAVELHGVGHLEAEQWSTDLARANEIVIGGRRLLAFSSFSVRRQRAEVGDQLVRLFLARGWTKPDASRP
ncbi:hypothetical protein AERO_02380 [Aeromicrobium fastidiosum]|uniref:hypothetical protein n=1 Tax=Aeromicrobium fastidiosum TaxID=52699 RepID=UPI002023642C|nr:hypothetical protein [Aeromicrobium fastidiosum]MCL8250216.1 hypothetical protein [Aeromicrobium fastidiosum]